MPIFKDLLDKLGVRQFEIANLEGDDLMGVLVTWIEKHDIFDKVIIHSSDRDFYQFISDRVHVLRSVKEGGFAKKSDIETEFGVKPEDYTRLRAITGDASDNIPHLFRGVGPKTAAKWVIAGLDPACESWLGVPLRAREKLREVNVRFQLRERWDEIHTNYLASEIVRTADHPFLEKKVRADISALLDKVSQGYLLTDKRKRTDEGWRWLTEFTLKYEMADLFGRRKELWQLP